jgi:hypothetical protein
MKTFWTVVSPVRHLAKMSDDRKPGRQMSRMSVLLSLVVSMAGSPEVVECLVVRNVLGHLSLAFFFVWGFGPGSFVPGTEDPEVLLRVIHFVDGLDVT